MERYLTTTSTGSKFWFKSADTAQLFAEKVGGTYHGKQEIPAHELPPGLKGKTEKEDL